MEKQKELYGLRNRWWGKKMEVGDLCSAEALLEASEAEKDRRKRAEEKARERESGGGGGSKEGGDAGAGEGGGGEGEGKGKADAIKQGAARALCELSADNRKPLKTEGHLSRDPRAKERRKYGLKKARKAPQFSKR